jgi:hypothetical protein
LPVNRPKPAFFIRDIKASGSKDILGRKPEAKFGLWQEYLQFPEFENVGPLASQ